MKYKMTEVQKGFAKVNVLVDEKEDEWEVFLVQTEEIVDHLNLDTDEISYIERWFAYRHMKNSLGDYMFSYLPESRITGYSRRKDAIEACLAYCERKKNGEDIL